MTPGFLLGQPAAGWSSATLALAEASHVFIFVISDLLVGSQGGLCFGNQGGICDMEISSLPPPKVSETLEEVARWTEVKETRLLAVHLN